MAPEDALDRIRETGDLSRPFSASVSGFPDDAAPTMPSSPLAPAGR